MRFTNIRCLQFEKEYTDNGKGPIEARFDRWDATFGWFSFYLD